MQAQLQRFANQVVIVTGAGHGIGRAVAERFAFEGASVAVNDVSRDRASEVAEAIGPQAMSAPADVSNKAAVDRMFDEIMARFGRLDVLVNNAGNIHAA